jgi:hypothetical protein
MKGENHRGRATKAYTPRQQSDGTYGLGEHFGTAVGEILRESLSDHDLARWRVSLRLPSEPRERA